MASPSFGPRPGDVRGANRAVTWSVIVHVVIVVSVMLMPKSWFAKKPAPPVMTISLGGTPGPSSTGQTSMGGRTVEQVAPPPKRPEPVRPEPKAPVAPPAPPVAAAMPTKAAATKPAPTKSPEAVKIAPLPPARSLVTGAQIVKGNTAVDTGARGLGAGLSFGGGSAGGETDLKSDFCCPEYLQQILGSIGGNWQKNQPESGSTVLKFTIERSGAITHVEIDQSSGIGVLDREARRALLATQGQLPPLPSAYTRTALTVHLTFPYGTQ